MEIVLALVVGALCMACFFIGAKAGRAAGKDMKAPTISPMKAYKAHQTKRESEMEQNRIDAIMRNIESYDGTGRGQEDVPGR